MKKNRIYLALAALAVLSCAKEPVREGGLADAVRVETLTARIAATKSTLDRNGNFSWEAGDQIAVHRSESGYESSPLTEDGAFNVHLSGMEQRDAFAIFPASIADPDAYTAANLKVCLPAEYTIARAGMALGTPAPMIAVNDPSSSDLCFRHIGGVLRLSLDHFPYETRRVVVNVGKRITGEFAVTGANTDAPQITLDEGAAGDVVFNLSSDLFVETDGYTLNIPLPVGEYDRLTFTAYDKYGNVLSSHSDDDYRVVGRACGVLEELDFAADTKSLPLCAKSVSGSRVSIKNPLGLTIEYSTDLTNWTSFSESNWSIDLEEGECVYFRGDNASYSNGDSYSGSTRFSCTAPTYLYGNVMSLVDSDGFATNTELTEPYAFYYLFVDPGKDEPGKFRSHPSLKLELPATTLTPYCYSYMFYYNHYIARAPELPATVLEEGCYSNMFYECKKLKEIPGLPATTLAKNCYYYMFYRCYALLSAPDLPATTMAENCYGGMFSYCWNLKTAPRIAAEHLAASCFSNMFSGCDDLRTAPSLPCTELAESCYSGMFSSCKNLTQAPVLPATTMAKGCYSFMFAGCHSLVNAPALPATTLAEECYRGMLNSCKSLVTAPVLPATTLAEYCYAYMFAYDTLLTGAPVLPATTLAHGCYNQMFQNCSSLETAPVLPATSLVSECYNSMFSGCSSLNYVKAMFTEEGYLGGYLDYWLSGVSGTGTFVMNSAAQWDPESNRGESGIPYGWTLETASE